MTSRMIVVVAGFAWLGLVECAVAETFRFEPGHYYSTDGLWGGGADVIEYNQAGQMITGARVPGATDLSTLAFGPDGNLYVLALYYDGNFVTHDFLSLNANLEIQQRYAFPTGARGSGILFDDAGHFYFGNARFYIGAPNSGQIVLHNDTYLEEILPNGHLLVVQGSALYELDSNRHYLRQVLSNQTPAGNVAYDPQTRTLYASGEKDLKSWIWKVDFDSGVILDSVRWQVSDLHMTREGLLLVSGFDDKAALLDTNLRPVLYLNNYPEAITQYVPEPTGWALALTGVGGLTLLRRRIERH